MPISTKSRLDELGALSSFSTSAGFTTNTFLDLTPSTTSITASPRKSGRKVERIPDPSKIRRAVEKKVAEEPEEILRSPAIPEVESIEFHDEKTEDRQQLPQIENITEEDHLMKIKRDFLNTMTGSMVASPNFKAPNPQELVIKSIMDAAENISKMEPEFVLKVALYTRLDLNIRTGANFLLALSASLPSCRPFLKKYFKAAVRLPSDWTEVVEIYQAMFPPSSKGLPAALRKVMTDKFEDFDEYQLAKYNKQKKVKKRKGKNQGQKSQKPKSKAITLKRLIRTLHVRRPVEPVMAIVGKRYPSDSAEFYQSGLVGVWDEARAGKRMRLAIPETWETKISLHGNKAHIWEELLDSKKLPFMAMLRNLRNMIKVGVSPQHHDQILRRLQDKRSVINSRQFPFRFFSAYEALEELRKELLQKASVAPPPALKVKRKGKKVQKKDKQRRGPLKFDEALLDRYEKGLDSAVKISTAHNIPLIPGRTIVLCNVGTGMSSVCGSGMGKTKTAKEVGILLALMCKHSSESCKLFIYGNKEENRNSKHVCVEEIKHLPKGTILQNMKVVLDKAEQGLGSSSGKNIHEELNQLTLNRTKVDNILMINESSEGSSFDKAVMQFLRLYREKVNPAVFYVNLCLTAQKSSPSIDMAQKEEEGKVYLHGFSDKLLAFMSERSNGGQLQYVDGIDKQHDLPEPLLRRLPTNTLSLEQIKQSLHISPHIKRGMKMRTVSVFISSTFRDMGPEREVLLRFVFPELERRLGTSHLRLIPVDLRWGIRAEDQRTGRAVEECLKEVEKCEFLVGVLGERKGYCPSPKILAKIVARNPSYSWLLQLDKPSVTEMEITLFALLRPERARGKTFIFVRASHELEYDSAADRMKPLKQRLENNGFQLQKYFMNGKVHTPHSLQDFAKLVVANVWPAIKTTSNICQSSDDPSVLHAQQWAHIEFLTKVGPGRSKLLSEILGKISEGVSGPLLLKGFPCSGKSTLMAELCSRLEELGESLVIPLFSEGWTGSEKREKAQKYLQWIASQVSLESRPYTKKENDPSTDIFAGMAGFRGRIVLVVDGWEEGELAGLLSSASKPVLLLYSATIGSPLYKALSELKLKSVWTVPSLDMKERMGMIRGTLGDYGKTLDERAFQNQMGVLTSKRDSGNPAFLQAACSSLRLSANFETLKEEMLRLPSTLPLLLKAELTRLQALFRPHHVQSLFALLSSVHFSLSEADLYPSWDLLLDGGSHPPALPRTPLSTFLRLLHQASPLLLHRQGRVELRFSALRSFLKTQKTIQDQTKAAKKALAAVLLRRTHRGSSDIPKDDWKHLISLLKENGGEKGLIELAVNHAALSSILGHGLHHFLASALAHLAAQKKRAENEVSVADSVSQFIFNEAHFLRRFPELSVQQAGNLPDSNPLHVDPSPTKHWKVVVWENRPRDPSSCVRAVRYAGPPRGLGSLAVDEKSALLAVAPPTGSITLSDYQSGEVSLKLAGHHQEVTSMCFVNRRSGLSLVTGSKDGTLTLWSCAAGTKISSMKGHSGLISGVVSLPWGRTSSLLTASWDASLKSWNVETLKWVEEISAGSPINCVSVHSKDPLACTGHWDGAIRIFNLATQKRVAVLRNHGCPVRVLRFGGDEKQIISGGMDGDLILSCASTGRLVGSLEESGSEVTGLAVSQEEIVSSDEDGRLVRWGSELGSLLTSTPPAFSSVSTLRLNSDGDRLFLGFRDGSFSLHDITDSSSEQLWRNRSMELLILDALFINKKDDILVITAQSAIIVSSKDGKRIGELGVDERICSATGSRDNVALGLANGVLALYDIAAGEWRNRGRMERSGKVAGHSGPLTATAMSPDAMQVATAGEDKGLTMWNTGLILMGKGEAEWNVVQAHSDRINSLSWSDSKQILVTGSSDNSVKLWDPATGASTKTFTHHSSPVLHVSISNGLIGSVCAEGRVMVCWAGGAFVSSITSTPVSALALLRTTPQQDWAGMMDEADESPERKKEEEEAFLRTSVLAIGHPDGSAGIYRPSLGKKVSEVVEGEERITGMERGGREVVTVDRGGKARWWRPGPTLHFPHHGPVTAIATNQRLGLHLTGGRDGWLKLYNNSGEIIDETSAHINRPIAGVLWVEERKDLFVSASEDGLFLLWQVQASKLMLKCSNRLPEFVSGLERAGPLEFRLQTWSQGSLLVRLEEKSDNCFLSKLIQSSPVWDPREVEDLWEEVEEELRNKDVDEETESILATSPITPDLRKDLSKGFLKAVRTKEENGTERVILVSAAEDNVLRIWTPRTSGDGGERTLQLDACWPAPGKVTAAGGVEGGVWVGDVLGRVHRLRLLPRA